MTWSEPTELISLHFNSLIQYFLSTHLPFNLLLNSGIWPFSFFNFIFNNMLLIAVTLPIHSSFVLSQSFGNYVFNPFYFNSKFWLLLIFKFRFRNQVIGEWLLYSTRSITQNHVNLPLLFLTRTTLYYYKITNF